LYPNGAVTTHLFDAAGNLQRIRNVDPAGTPISDLTYGYDRAGNRTIQQEADGTLTTWTYDPTYQLLNERRSGTAGFNATYTYDLAGNRSSEISAGGTTTYAYSPANRVLKATGPAGQVTTYAHDAAGNRTQAQDGIDTTYYAWDAAGRMVTAEPPAGVVTLTYNTDGQRTAKASPDGGDTRFLYDLKKLLQETDADGDGEWSYLNTADGEFGSLIGEYDEEGAAAYTPQFDAQWSAEALLDEAGGVAETFRYRAFGLAIGSMAASRWGAQKGYYVDPETELYLLGGGSDGRYYDPAAGRFPVTPAPHRDS
jgi:YD repeat-containing protein